MNVEREGISNPSITLLDCTLRDGGYYNDWDFATSLNLRYLDAVSRARIAIAEVGFRSGTTDGYAGPNAFTTDDFLRALDPPDGLTLAVMVNAKEVLASGDAPAFVRRLFQPSSESPVSWVRIAANYSEVADLAPAVDALHELGYRVGLNLMQVGLLGEHDVASFGTLAQGCEADVAYFADSLGALRPGNIPPIVAALRSTYSGPLGCHMHDNMSMAFANTLAAIDAGATFVDGTILGMGRGPGNARSEYLAIDLARRGLADLDPAALLDLVTDDFASLRDTYGWGTNIYYFLSAAYGVHPTYIHEMTRDGRYSVDQIVAALGDLRDGGGSGFSIDKLRSASARRGFADCDGTWNATDWCRDRDVLVVGPGPAGQAHRLGIEQWVRTRQPLVIALNAVPPIDDSLVDAYVVCDPLRAAIDHDLIAKLSRPVFLPEAALASILDLPDHVETRDYGMRVQPGAFDVAATQCTVPRVLAAAYAFALATAGSAASIFLTGFDGFEPGDARQAEMADVFQAFAEYPDAPPVVALTRTSYAIPQSSLYAP